ncbi:4Fe-4S dicluster domain-containing protein [Halodesulfovibrio marinisediminis]|uniref:Electron transport complex protein RnfC n=1 Tax=Halodesulfovibrio marinisediminis DSM 17456 TaxID=1121457 RepID=A0A1N6F4R3_9BACT|nr:4Fe-4S dicluster domain-containing protein [Halodesulfovibrio marinisediminis]SIN90282.1 electron transport complex protein RnfC [Halodesulfovibrio marinisediminis DSM 17456]
MNKNIFILTHGDTGAFETGSVPFEVRIPLNGHGKKSVKKKAEVYPGLLVADHKNDKIGDMHSGITGVVTEVTETQVIIKAQELAAPAEGEEPKPTGVEPVDLASLEGEELQAALKGLGVDIRPFIRRCDLLILNALNPEPGITYAESMLVHAKSTINAGLDMLKRLSPASRTVVALPTGSTAAFDGSDVAFIEPAYPNSLDELVVAKITGKEIMKGVNVVSLHMLYNLGAVAESGMPLTHTVVCVEGKNIVAPIGTPVGALLKDASIEVTDSDTVIMGGPMRGEATGDLNKGISKDTNALFVMPAGSTAPISDHACFSCGACIQHCPSRIQPNMISRYVEFNELDFCRQENINACMECGLCTYYCPARRPMLQYIRLGKHKIALEESQVAACALQVEE